jgi:hypothetical protein
MKLGRLVTLLIAGWLALAQAAFAAGLARLVELKGEVQVQSHGSDTWHPGREAEELAAGDAVRTGAASEVTVARNDGTTVSLLPFAQLVIEDELGFLVRAGRVWSHFTKALGAPFFIRTPDATALIRGTTLGVGYEEERSRVTVYEGLVEVRDREEHRQDVAGGYWTRAGRFACVEAWSGWSLAVRIPRRRSRKGRRCAGAISPCRRTGRATHARIGCSMARCASNCAIAGRSARSGACSARTRASAASRTPPSACARACKSVESGVSSA